MPLWIGTYPPGGLGDPPGQGEGLWVAELAADGSLAARQVVVANAPSFVAAHPSQPLVYAVSEDRPTVLHVCDARAEAVVATVVTDAVEGSHLHVTERAVYLSAYDSGELLVILLDDAGLPLADAPHQSFRYEGSGPRADRQTGPHAHFSAPSPDGGHLLVADLGSDTLWAHALLPDGTLEAQRAAARLPAGSGPRHFAARGELLYLVCELDHTLRTLRWERPSATAELIAEQPVTLVPQRSGEGVFDAHVALVERPQGDVLLASVRGADVVSVFDLSPEGEARYRAAFDAGCWPRHFAVVPGAVVPGGAVSDSPGEPRVVVAASRQHELRSFALADVLALPPEAENGVVATLPFASTPVRSPACVCARLGA